MMSHSFGFSVKVLWWVRGEEDRRCPPSAVQTVWNNPTAARTSPHPDGQLCLVSVSCWNKSWGSTGRAEKVKTPQMPRGTEATELVLGTSSRHEQLWGKPEMGRANPLYPNAAVVRSNNLLVKLSNIWCLCKILLFTSCCSSLFCSTHSISPFSTGSSKKINFSKLLLLPVPDNFPFLPPPLEKAEAVWLGWLQQGRFVRAEGIPWGLCCVN